MEKPSGQPLGVEQGPDDKKSQFAEAKSEKNPQRALFLLPSLASKPAIPKIVAVPIVIAHISSVCFPNQPAELRTEIENRKRSLGYRWFSLAGVEVRKSFFASSPRRPAKEVDEPTRNSSTKNY